MSRGSQFLVLREILERTGTMRNQPAGSSVNRLLETWVGDGLVDLERRGAHREARTSARCMVRMGNPARRIAPSSCMRQLESIETTVLLSVLKIESILVRAM